MIDALVLQNEDEGALDLQKVRGVKTDRRVTVWDWHPLGVTRTIPVPTVAQVKAVVPAECYERRLSTSLRYAAVSLILTLATAALAWRFIPLEWAWTPAWLLYAYANGTIAVGLWVIAHECGHRGFAEGTKVQDTIGFVLHSALLVPYFSWQRSHAIHHGRTNHVIEGETHVPKRATTSHGARTMRTQARLGSTTHGLLTIASRLGFGWPVYLIAGSTGGAERGVTNHFWPIRPFSGALFPDRWRAKVWWSALGVTTVVGLLAWWAVAGGVAQVLALYVGPYLVVNAWLVTYTWLQHTDVDVPHYDGDDWSFMSGAFCTIDRPYGPIADFLHHRIGTTHVAHHIDAKIPHYQARKATAAIAAAFPDHYRHDPTPVRRALWRVATRCHVVAETDDGWRFEPELAVESGAPRDLVA